MRTNKFHCGVDCVDRKFALRNISSIEAEYKVVNSSPIDLWLLTIYNEIDEWHRKNVYKSYLNCWYQWKCIENCAYVWCESNGIVLAFKLSTFQQSILNFDEVKQFHNFLFLDDLMCSKEKGRAPVPKQSCQYVSVATTNWTEIKAAIISHCVRWNDWIDEKRWWLLFVAGWNRHIETSSSTLNEIEAICNV